MIALLSHLHRLPADTRVGAPCWRSCRRQKCTVQSIQSPRVTASKGTCFDRHVRALSSLLARVFKVKVALQKQRPEEAWRVEGFQGLGFRVLRVFRLGFGGRGLGG